MGNAQSSTTVGQDYVHHTEYIRRPPDEAQAIAEISHATVLASHSLVQNIQCGSKEDRPESIDAQADDRLASELPTGDSGIKMSNAEGAPAQRPQDSSSMIHLNAPTNVVEDSTMTDGEDSSTTDSEIESECQDLSEDIAQGVDEPPWSSFSSFKTNRPSWNADEDPEIIAYRAGIAAATLTINKSCIPKSKNNSCSHYSRRFRVSRQLKTCKKVYEALKSHVPRNELAQHRYKIVVKPPNSSRLTAKRTLKTLMWYKGWRKTTVLTILRLHCDAIAESFDDYCMVCCGRLVDNDERLEELDLMHDQQIVLFCVPLVTAHESTRPIAGRIERKVRKALYGGPVDSTQPVPGFLSPVKQELTQAYQDAPDGSAPLASMSPGSLLPEILHPE